MLSRYSFGAAGPVLLALLLAAPPSLAKQPDRVRVTVFYLDGGTPDAALLANVSRRFKRGLRRNRRLRVLDSDKLLAAFAGTVPDEALRKAASGYKNGLKLIAAGDAAQAVQVLTDVVETLELNLAFAKKRHVARAMLALGAAEAAAGRARQAVATFARLLVWRPKVLYDPNKLPATHLPLFEQARARVKRRRRGSVELISTPAGAKAYVDGRFVGVTPAIAFGLRVGGHYATIKKLGFKKAVFKITVDPRRQRSYRHKLARSPKYLLVERALKEARRSFGAAKIVGAVADLRNVLLVEHVVLARVSPAKRPVLEAHLYDLRSKLRLNKAKVAFSRDDLSGVEDLARLLYVNVSYDGSLTAPPEPPPPPPKRRRPFYATWWFWTAIAAGAAAVTLPIIFWPESHGCPDNRRCASYHN